MKNSKGQALVEFILVLPIFLLVIISIIDLGNIISKKYSLENDLDTIVDMYNDNNIEKINYYISDKDIKINYDKKDDLIIINLSKKVKIISPVINLIFGKNYDLNTSRSIYKNE